MDYEKAGKRVQYINVVKDRNELPRMLQYSKGVREVPVIVDAGVVTIGYGGS